MREDLDCSSEKNIVWGYFRQRNVIVVTLLERTIIGVSLDRGGNAISRSNRHSDLKCPSVVLRTLAESVR